MKFLIDNALSPMIAQALLQEGFDAREAVLRRVGGFLDEPAIAVGFISRRARRGACAGAHPTAAAAKNGDLIWSQGGSGHRGFILNHEAYPGCLKRWQGRSDS